MSLVGLEGNRSTRKNPIQPQGEYGLAKAPKPKIVPGCLCVLATAPAPSSNSQVCVSHEIPTGKFLRM